MRNAINMDWIKRKKVRKIDGLVIDVVVRYIQVDGAFKRYYQRDGYSKSFYTDDDFENSSVWSPGDGESMEYKMWSSCFKGPDNPYYRAFLYETVTMMYKYQPKAVKVDAHEKEYINSLKETISDYKEKISPHNLYRLFETECLKIINEKFEEIV